VKDHHLILVLRVNRLLIARAIVGSSILKNNLVVSLLDISIKPVAVHNKNVLKYIPSFKISAIPIFESFPPATHSSIFLKALGVNSDSLIVTGLTPLSSSKMFSLQILLDTGASKCFINKHLVKTLNLVPEPAPIKYNLILGDGSKSDQVVSEQVSLKIIISGHHDTTPLLVADLGDTDMILGLDWFATHNPNIDFTSQSLSFRNPCPGNTCNSCVLTEVENSVGDYESFTTDCESEDGDVDVVESLNSTNVIDTLNHHIEVCKELEIQIDPACPTLKICDKQ
jgi:hypothetical protein